ncbi:MAG: beta-ketoacyl-[acyl-carrier-protein] synthase family protein [Isosphaeraceae bacterium]
MAARNEPVWITGIGAATPLGFGFEAVAEAMLSGRSGVGAVRHFEPVDQPCRIAATLGTIPTPEGWPEADFRGLGGWDQLLLYCALEALRDAGLPAGGDRLGILLGIGSEWLLSWEGRMCARPADEPTEVVDPREDTRSLVSALADRLGAGGPCSTVAAACASGNVALAQGRRWVERGLVDACLVGACDRSLTPMGMAGFGNLGALSGRNDDPMAASRPFDRGRDGFVMGEAGAIFLIESAAHARRRGARPYGRIAGFGASSDAYHMVIPGADPGPCVRAMRSALADAGVDPADVDYVNAHATSTPIGDKGEARVLQEVFGASALTVPVSSTKSMTGHMLGATAAVEALACLAAFRHRAIPPTINLDDPDPECQLFHVAHQAMERDVEIAVSNSFGFGGSNTCLVLGRVA